jgi:succinate dehydrogenase hydrophobic anchor subunit
MALRLDPRTTLVLNICNNEPRASVLSKATLYTAHIHSKNCIHSVCANYIRQKRFRIKLNLKRRISPLHFISDLTVVSYLLSKKQNFYCNFCFPRL